MFEQHFGLRENPFHSGHQMRFLYPSREHQEARAHLRYGIENREPFVLITGEVGTGKTTALYDALAEWGTQVAVALITNSALTREELIEEIALRFGLAVAPGTSKPQALAALERHLLGVRARGEHAVLLLDEAQNLANELLEEIRLLSNLETHGEKLVQIFLVGQPELEAKLAMPQLRQLKQRITVHYRLNPLSPEETTGYIHHRISVAGGNPFATFPPETCHDIYRLTHGIPREINTVASQALIAAFSEGAHTVRTDHVDTIAREYRFHSVLGAPVEFDPDAAPAAPPAPFVTEAPEPIAAPEPEPESEPEPAPSVEPEPAPHVPPHVEPAGEAAPAWLPPDLESAAPEPEAAAEEATVDHVNLSELDAWTRAAQELLEAKRRTGSPAAPPERVEVVTYEEHDEGLALERGTPPAGATEEPARFPTPAELYARAEAAQPDSADLSGLPQRLREKIAADIERDERPRRALPITLVAVIVAALAIGVVLLQRFQVIDLPLLRGIAGGARSATTAQPASAAATVPASRVVTHDSLATTRDTTHAAAPTSAVVAAKPAPASTTTLAAAKPIAPPVVNAKPAPKPLAQGTGMPTNVVPATKPAPPVAKPVAAATKPAPAKPTASAATTAPATPATPATKPASEPAAPKPAASAKGPAFGVGIAHYLDADRAEIERDHFAKSTNLPAVVVPYKDGTTTMYRVVLGSYPNNAAAERAANQIMERYGVTEALVFVLPKAKAN